MTLNSSLACGFVLLLAPLLISACAAAPEYPAPKESEFQILVKLTASPKVGVKGPAVEGGYEKESVEKGKRFKRVDYADMAEIAVYLEKAPAGGPAPMEADWVISDSGVNHDLLLLGPGKNTLRIANKGGKTLSLYASGGEDVLFDESIASGSTFALKDIKPGHYEICCDEDRFVHCELVVAPSSYAALAASGEEVFFNMSANVGGMDVVVVAPRLPTWRKAVHTLAGKRETVYADLTVNTLPKK